MAALKSYDGRLSVHHYPPDELERMIVADAVQGLDMHPQYGEPFLWWAVQAYIRIAKARRVSPDHVFEGVQHRIMAETGRAWP